MGDQFNGRPATSAELETLAWGFLSSPYTDYWSWPLDRRVDAYLRRLRRTDIINDGAAHSELIEHVMDSLARARRDGLLDEHG